MGLYIKGMEMPKSCSRCFCMASCKLWKNIMHPEFDRHRNCPLVPVPPHGKLKDADALLKKCEFVCTDDDVDVRAVRYSVIDAAPTIIPADPAEEV